jgi:copper chaperone CopZ
MKTIKQLIILFLLASASVVTSGQEKEKTLQTVKFATSIDCDDCVNTIMNNLPKEKGIKDVKCDLKTKEVTVTYQQDKTNTEMVQRKIEKLGYTARPVKVEDTAEKK